MRILLSITLLIITLPNSLLAEDYFFERYAVEEGLHHLYVYSITQDSSGFLWVGTNDGAFRFDGFEFDYYTTAEGLSENFVTKVFTDRKGRVWFGHQGGSVSLLENDVLSPFELQENQHGAVMDFHEDGAGRIWILVQNLGLIKLDQDLEPQIFRFSEDEPTLSCITALDDDVFLLGTQEELYLGILDEASSTFVNTSQVTNYPGSKVSDILRIKEGSYIVITQEEGVYSLVLEKHSGLNILNPILENKDGALDQLQEGIILDNGDLLISSMGSGIIRLSKDELGLYRLSETINSQNGLQSDNVKSIFQDGQGNLWCGLYGEGLSRKVRNNFLFYKLKDDGRGNAYALAGSKDIIMVGTDGEILILDHAGNLIKTIALPGKLKQDRINAIHRGPDNTYFIGFEKNGLYFLEGPHGRLIKIWLSDNPLSNAVNHITGDDEYIWVSTKHGLCRIDFNKGEKRWYTTNDGLPYNSVQAAYIDSKKRVLISTIAKGISFINPEGELEVGESISGSLMSINSVYEDGKGQLWISTEGEGLWRSGENGFINITEEDGLFSNYCYSLSENAAGKLLVGHRGAMSEVDTESLDIMVYGPKDGIQSSTEFYLSAVYMDKDKNTWFGTSSGLIKSVSDYQRQARQAPLLNIKALYIDGETRQLGKAPYRLKPGNHEIRITYCGINFQDPGAVLYETMLEGYSSGWSPPRDQREVVYEKVNYGAYHFLIRASNGAGKVSELTFDNFIIIEKPVYLRAWFLIAVLLLISLAFVLAIKVSSRKHKSEQKRLLDRLNEKSREIIVKEEIIKERKRSEKVLLEAKNRAETSEKVKSAFLRNMSHEIRTPMNAIMGFSNLLKQEGLKKGQRDQYVDLINDNSVNLIKIIDDILDVSKLEASQVKLNIQTCDLRQTMASLEKYTKNLLEKADKSKLELHISIPSEGNHLLETDKERIVQVFQKLLDNAVKFTETGKICFGYSFEEDKIRFFVEDTGIGISGDKHDEIFESFRKVAESKLQLFSGTGLGLTIARMLTNLLGGHLTVYSESENGTVFSFELGRDSIKIPEDLSQKDFSSNKLTGRWKGKKILIVEDSESNYLLLETLLNQTGIEITRAIDGETALSKYFGADVYNLIIMDIKLPGIDGYETTKRIRKKDKLIKIVAYTAYAEIGTREKVLSSGFDDYIPKPSSNMEILKIISNYLDESVISANVNSFGQN